MLRLDTYNEKLIYLWDDFVEESLNGTLFHKQKFLSYHGNKFQDASILMSKDDEIVSVFPATIQNNCLWSHPGASFGGPVIGHTGIETMLEVVETIESYAQKICLDKVTMVLTPNVFHKQPVEGIEFALFYNGFRTEAVELSICVPLGQAIFSDRRRRGIAKAKRHDVVVQQSNDFKTYWKILNNNLRIRHSVEPTHTLDDILKLKALFHDEIKLFGAFREREMIAGVVVFINNSTSFETFYIAQNYSHQGLRAMDLLIDFIYQWGVNEGFKYMNFGITSEGRGTNINFGLAKFKEEFGGCDIVRRIYTKEITSGNTEKNVS